MHCIQVQALLLALSLTENHNADRHCPKAVQCVGGGGVVRVWYMKTKGVRLDQSALLKRPLFGATTITAVATILAPPDFHWSYGTLNCKHEARSSHRQTTTHIRNRTRQEGWLVRPIETREAVSEPQKSMTQDGQDS
jgi:hypothetical protein